MSNLEPLRVDFSLTSRGAKRKKTRYGETANVLTHYAKEKVTNRTSRAEPLKAKNASELRLKRFHFL